MYYLSVKLVSPKKSKLLLRIYSTNITLHVSRFSIYKTLTICNIYLCFLVFSYFILINNYYVLSLNIQCELEFLNHGTITPLQWELFLYFNIYYVFDKFTIFCTSLITVYIYNLFDNFDIFCSLREFGFYTE